MTMERSGIGSTSQPSGSTPSKCCGQIASDEWACHGCDLTMRRNPYSYRDDDGHEYCTEACFMDASNSSIGQKRSV